MEELISKKGMYELWVGISKEYGFRCYQLFNSKYRVIEAETCILSQAFKFLEELSSSTDVSMDDIE